MGSMCNHEHYPGEWRARKEKLAGEILVSRSPSHLLNKSFLANKSFLVSQQKKLRAPFGATQRAGHVSPSAKGDPRRLFTSSAPRALQCRAAIATAGPTAAIVFTPSQVYQRTKQTNVSIVRRSTGSALRLVQEPICMHACAVKISHQVINR